MSKRGNEKRITLTARILRYMRQSRGISLNRAGELAGITGPAISHIEQGRMDVSDERIQALVRAYGYSMDEFLDYLDGEPLPVSYRDECIVLIGQLDEPKLKAVHALLKCMES